MGKRHALLIASVKYEDRRIPALAAPRTDVEALQDVLRDPSIGAFDEVKSLINRSESEVRRAIADLFQERRRDDFVLLYFSGHGAMDRQRRLYLLLHDSKPDRLNATAVPAAFISQEMEDSAARRQILILDCCHSGAFVAGSKGVIGEPVDSAAQLGWQRKDVEVQSHQAADAEVAEDDCEARVVMTASDATQYAFEGIPGEDGGQPSLFTRYMVEGLRSGAADLKGRGEVTLQSLYDYVYAQVKAHQPAQEPCLIVQKQRGTLVIAKTATARLDDVPLPPKVRSLIEDRDRDIVLLGVERLRPLLLGEDRGLAHAAQRALEDLATQHENLRVRAAAKEALERAGATAPAASPRSSSTPPPVGELRHQPPGGAPRRTALYLVGVSAALALTAVAGAWTYLQNGRTPPREEVAEKRAVTARPAPLKEVLRVRVSAEERPNPSEKKPYYDFSLQLEAPEPRMREISRVRYVFPKGYARDKQATQPPFKVTYYGWGCISPVQVLVETEDHLFLSLDPVDMCTELGWEH